MHSLICFVLSLVSQGSGDGCQEWLGKYSSLTCSAAAICKTISCPKPRLGKARPDNCLFFHVRVAAISGWDYRSIQGILTEVRGEWSSGNIHNKLFSVAEVYSTCRSRL